MYDLQLKKAFILGKPEAFDELVALHDTEVDWALQNCPDKGAALNAARHAAGEFRMHFDFVVWLAMRSNGISFV